MSSDSNQTKKQFNWKRWGIAVILILILIIAFGGYWYLGKASKSSSTKRDCEPMIAGERRPMACTSVGVSEGGRMYKFNGSACEHVDVVNCGGCEGPDCDKLIQGKKACQREYSHCIEK